MASSEGLSDIVRILQEMPDQPYCCYTCGSEPRTRRSCCLPVESLSAEVEEADNVGVHGHEIP